MPQIGGKVREEGVERRVLVGEERPAPPSGRVRACQFAALIETTRAPHGQYRPPPY